MKELDKIGEFKLTQRIATGGMAEIYRAEAEGPEGFNKSVVIKRILPQFSTDPEFIEMFLDEAKLVSQLKHPKIAQIYTLGQDGDNYFIAMELVDGMNLDHVIQRCNANHQLIPAPIAVRLMCDVLEALDYAHNFVDANGVSYGIVHRDVTPHNILLSNEGIVKLVDFGVAKARQQRSKTQAGAVKGKYSYMAPEQIENRTVDKRADIFAAGIVLFELLTGEKPFGEDLVAIANIQSADTPNPRRLRKDLPISVVACIKRSLEKLPEDRYPDANEMRRALETILRSEYDYVGDRELRKFIEVVNAEQLTLDQPEWTNLSLANSLRPTEPLVDLRTTLENLDSIERERLIGDTQDLTNETLHAQKTERYEPIYHTSDASDESPPRALHALKPSHDPQYQKTEATPAIHLPTIPTDAVPPKKKKTGFIFLVSLILLSLSAVAIAPVIFSLVVGTDDSPAPPTINAQSSQPKISQAAPPNQKPADKKKPLSRFERTKGTFDHPKGELVRIVRKNRVDLFYNSEPIGDTPLQTKLKPGNYTVHYKANGKSYKKSFSVKKTGKIQTIFLDGR